jgi:hypothetical protein
LRKKQSFASRSDSIVHATQKLDGEIAVPHNKWAKYPPAMDRVNQLDRTAGVSEKQKNKAGLCVSDAGQNS